MNIEHPDILSTINCRHSMLSVIGICLLFTFLWINVFGSSKVEETYRSRVNHATRVLLVPGFEVVRGVVGSTNKKMEIKPPMRGLPC